MLARVGVCWGGVLGVYGRGVYVGGVGVEGHVCVGGSRDVWTWCVGWGCKDVGCGVGVKDIVWGWGVRGGVTMYVWREGGDSICMLCISFTITVSVCKVGFTDFRDPLSIHCIYYFHFFEQAAPPPDFVLSMDVKSVTASILIR